MVNIQNAKEWLKASLDDLETISELLDNENLTNISAFHAQQSIEKSFKALIEYKQLKLQKTHNLEKLYCSINKWITIKNLTLLEIIDELYIDSRYPGDMGLLPYGKPTLEDAQEFHKFALKVFEIVCNHLKVNIETIKDIHMD